MAMSTLSNLDKDVADELQLLHIFPIEVWEHILSRKNVKNGEDVRNLSASCRFFHHVLGDNGLLWIYLWRDIRKVLTDLEERQRSIRDKALGPHPVGRELTKKERKARDEIHDTCDTCGFRLISTGIDESVGAFSPVGRACDLEDDWWKIDNQQDEDLLWTPVSIDHDLMERLYDYQHDERVADEDISLGKELIVIVTPRNNCSLLEFLEKFGEQIWFCTMGVSQNFPRKVECHRRLREVLTFMPNLKGLAVHYGDFHVRKFPPPKYDRDNVTLLPNRPMYEMPFNGKGLSEELENNPLPPLERLQFLSTTDLSGFLRGVIGKAYASKVKRLHIARSDDVAWTGFFEHYFANKMSSSPDRNRYATCSPFPFVREDREQARKRRNEFSLFSFATCQRPKRWRK